MDMLSSNQLCDDAFHHHDDLNGKVTKMNDASRPPKIRRVQEINSTPSPDNLLPEEFVSSEMDPDKIDSMIAQEMASLSMQDREKALYDIHGIPEHIEETPELLQSSLQQLDVELLKLRYAPAFEQAKQMNRKFVEDEAFRLMFLRADLFDPRKAAERMAHHFHVKLELFGCDMLTRNISQDDLDQDTLKVIYSGMIQRLIQRDRAGRFVSVRFQQPSTGTIITLLRAMFYLSMDATRDEETQRKGRVVVAYLVGKPPDIWKSFHFRREVNLKMPDVLEAVPLRLVGIHLCHDFPLAWRILLAAFKLAAKQPHRIRIREHCGDRKECLLSLRSFGIPTDDFPLDPEGNIIVERHKQRMKELRRVERQRFLKDQMESGDPTVGAGGRRRVVIPAEYDVLLGRGKASYQHAGNVTLRRLVEERRPAYEMSNQSEKAKMSAEIVAIIHQANGCFLEDDGTSWVEVSETVARRKVAHAFRTMRQQSRITNESD